MHASSAPAPVDSEVARDGARYELIGELASGGMATVYLARMRGSMGLSRLVAIKAMHPHYAKDSAFTSMFVDEARLTARLRHPNVVPTLDIVAGAGQLLLVMEYVEGESLSALVKATKEAGERIPVAIACAIMHDALLGLHAAHEAKDDDGQHLAIIHRDVSPQNVMVGVDGLARVLDFGVAKARRTVHFSHDGEIKGKVPYMPPEQLFGETLDRTVDVYAAGVLLWEALVGGRLFDGANEEIIVKRIGDGCIVAPSARATGISPEVDAVVLKALAAKPGDRFPTALAMAEKLAAVVTLPSRTEIATWVTRFARRDIAPIAAPTLGSRPGPTDPTTDAGVVAAVRRSHAPDAPKQKPRGIVVVCAAIAVACAAVGLVSTQRIVVARGPVTAAAPPVIAPETAPVIAAPAPSPVLSAAPVVTASVAPAVVRLAPLAKTKPAVIAAAPAAVPVEEASKANCRPPYTVDGDGHRHYKVECL